MRLHSIARWSRSAGLLVLAALPAFAQQSAQPDSLTLAQAVQIALEKNPEHKAALADTRVASADVGAARSYLLPHLTFSEAATRSNDPVYVFGSKLRQQRFATPDFALNVLNRPEPYGNFATRFGGTWNLFDSFASWHGVSRAQRLQEAAGRQMDRTDQEIVFRVIESYYGVLLAKKQLEVAEQAWKTAQSILGESRDRFQSGVAVESDLLSAQVRLVARQQDLIRARNNVALARAQWTSAMGLASQGDFEPAEALAERTLPAVALEQAVELALQKRPDLGRVRSEEQVQQQTVAMAKSAFGPRINAFAGWEADNPTFVAGGGGNNWMAGIELQIDLFQGGAKRAQLSRERAAAEKIAALKQVATDAIRLEVRRAYYEVDAARQQAEVARAAVEQSQESLRINQNRYDAGLSTISDLLAAEESARRSQTDYWEAVYHYHTGYAGLELATGILTPHSPVVTP